MPNNLQECIDQVILALTEMKVAINEGEGDSEPKIQTQSVSPNRAVPKFNPEAQPPLPQSVPVNEEATFEELVAALKSERWPDAVNKHLICDHTNPQEKMARGRGVLELMVGGDVADLKFLDFGCGEGYSTQVAANKKAKLSVGYDVNQATSWTNSQENLIFTTDWEKVKENGPYNIILCFDVIDHSHETPAELLKKMKSVLTEDGKIYLRTHPWTSRHANHFYHNINKAYIHLVFSEDELKQIDPSWGQGTQYEFNVGYTKPIITYKNMIASAGLEVEHMREMKEEVEHFFSTPKIANRIKKATNMTEYPEFKMSLQFIDFVLTRKK